MRPSADPRPACRAHGENILVERSLPAGWEPVGADTRLDARYRLRAWLRWPDPCGPSDAWRRVSFRLDDPSWQSLADEIGVQAWHAPSGGRWRQSAVRSAAHHRLAQAEDLAARRLQTLDGRQTADRSDPRVVARGAARRVLAGRGPAGLYASTGFIRWRGWRTGGCAWSGNWPATMRSFVSAASPTSTPPCCWTWPPRSAIGGQAAPQRSPWPAAIRSSSGSARSCNRD